MTLAAHALAFGYRSRVVGRGLDLALASGEVLCVLGPNGAGKTTLLRTLLGLIQPLEGRVTISGRDLASLPRAAVAREVAYVPQASSSPFDFTLLEWVEMGRAAHLDAWSRPGKRDRDAALAALGRLGIEPLAGRTIGAVSGGERQLALIARALAAAPQALVMDEPTANLDFGNQSRVLDEIGRLSASGIAILICSHDPDHALRLADRVLLLDRARSHAQGPAREMLTGENLSQLYGVTVHVAEVQTPAGRRRICVPALAA
jgi:iron complex transport system ATP-binding protein